MYSYMLGSIYDKIHPKFQNSKTTFYKDEYTEKIYQIYEKEQVIYRENLPDSEKEQVIFQGEML